MALGHFVAKILLYLKSQLKIPFHPHKKCGGMENGVWKIDISDSWGRE
jgi:hypothetical protein